MAALVEVLLRQTDPFVVLLLGILVKYVRNIKSNLKEELQLLRGRIQRLEDELIGDGGGEGE